jgi:hypothetical protein
MNTKDELQKFSKSKGMKWPVECHFYNWEYMIEFAELYANKVKNLDLHIVSQRSELLAFAKEMQEIGFNEMDDAEAVVDIYLKANCG